MFWRYGFDTTTSLETLLNRVDLNDSEGYDDAPSSAGTMDDGQSSTGGGTGSGGPPTVEELLEEQELLNELKVKNPKLVKVLSSKASIRSLLSWSIYGLDDLEAKVAEEWRNAEIEAEVRRAERNGSTSENGVSHTSRGSDGNPQSDQASVEENAESLHSTSSSSCPHLPEIIPQLSSTTVIPIDTEGELKRQRFSQIATEVLCADIWEIQSKFASDFPGFLEPFWEAALGYGITNDMWDRPDAPRDGEDEESWRVRQRQYAVVQQTYEQRHTAAPSSSIQATSTSAEEDDKRREILRNNFTRVNNALLTHHAAGVFSFVKTLPGVLVRMLDRIESTAMQDLVLKLICLEEQGVNGVISWLSSENLIPQLYRRMSPLVNATTHAVIFDMIKAIVALSSPGAGTGVGAFNPNGGNGQDQNVQGQQTQQQVLTSPTDANTQIVTQHVGGADKDAAGNASDAGTTGGQRDNQLIREMVNKDNVDLLIGYMFADVVPSEEEKRDDTNRTPSVEKPLAEAMTNGNSTATPVPDHSFDPYDTPRLPSHASINSSFCNIINIFIELIRKNNSDFAEPHLFHTMRNRLIRLKQRAVEDRAEQRETERKAHAQGETVGSVPTEEEMDEIDRGKMEDVMTEMSGRMGIVHLGALMDALSDNVGKLQAMIEHPKSLAWSRTPGTPTPLTQERFRIMELYAELLHCSNMSILNRQQGHGPDYSSTGCLEGGLEALEKLGNALEGEAENGDEGAEDDEIEGEVQKAKELPVSICGSASHSRAASDQGDSMDEASMGHVDGSASLPDEEHATPAAIGVPPAAPPPPSQADVARLRDVLVQHPRIGDLAHGTSTAPDSEIATAASNVAVASTAAPSIKDEDMEESTLPAESQKLAEAEPQQTDFEDNDVLPIGDKLKQLLIRHHVMRSVVNLFFEYPLNNFLHNVVYDIIQQMLNGRINAGFNRELIIDLFNEARLIPRILDAEESAQGESGKRVRPCHMGHLLLIGEEVEKFLERCPADLYTIIQDSFERTKWDEYVSHMKQDKIRDSQPLGGARPQETLSRDDDSDSSDDEGAELSGALAGQPLTRAPSSGEAFKSSFGYGNETGEGEGSKDQFSRYFMRETHSNSLAFSDDDSDDSSSESPGHPVRNPNPRRLSEGFDDAFSPPTQLNDMDEDDAWGDFTSADAGAKDGDGEDPFGDSFAAPAVASSSRAVSHHRTPFTSADFAEQAFRQQYASETNTWTGSDEQTSPIEVPEGVMGDDSFESAAQFLAANWSIPGGDVGESLPLTMGSVTQAIHTPAGRRRSSVGSASSGSTISPGSSPENTRGLHPAAKIGRRNPRHLKMVSPPDPALINATTEDQQLGPGVSADTHVRVDGLLEREVNGQTVVAAQDDISLAATRARRLSR